MLQKQCHFQFYVLNIEIEERNNFNCSIGKIDPQEENVHFVIYLDL